jgi:DNA-binding transcriptional regulator YiaG
MTYPNYRALIASYRLKNNISQNKMAKMLEIPQETYRRWEMTGNALTSTEHKIIKNFNKIKNGTK